MDQNDIESQQQNKNKTRWTDRDWKWLVCVLIAIIIFIFTFRLGDNLEVINLFSFISSAVSIALAIIAIFIALKQDSDSRRVNEQTSNILSGIEFRLRTVDENVKIINDKVIQSFSEEKVEEYVSKAEGQESYSKEEVKKILSDMGNEIVSGVNKELSNNMKGIVNNTGLETKYVKRQALLDFINDNSDLSPSELHRKFMDELDLHVSVATIKQLRYEARFLSGKALD